MTNPELIENLYKIRTELHKEDHRLADTLDYLILIAKERLSPDR